MDRENLKKRLEGCYVTVPTLFDDADLELDLEATRSHVRFLIERGIDGDNAVLLAGGAAGDFSTMSFDERLAVAEAILEESVSAQSTQAIDESNSDSWFYCHYYNAIFFPDRH